MQIQSQTQIQDASQTTDPTASSAVSNVDGLANENTFLQLLVAQIKNQDPTNPTDSVQFLSQLAQFSQLEQLIGIRQELRPRRIVCRHHQSKQHHGNHELIFLKRRLIHVFFNSTFRIGREQHGLGRGGQQPGQFEHDGI